MELMVKKEEEMIQEQMRYDEEHTFNVPIVGTQKTNCAVTLKRVQNN